MSIAERLGCTVSELGSRMSHSEYLEWIAYYNYRDRQKRKLPPLMNEQAEIEYNIEQMKQVLS